MTLEQLKTVAPRCPHLRLALLLPHYLAACAEWEISTPIREAAFVAQLAYESAEFRHFEELATGDAYEGRSDLGNTRPGDGRRYKGRGPIQITGRYNYRKYGALIGVPLEEEPERASDAAVGFRVAGAYWKLNGCNELADAGSFRTITRRINGGLAGQAQREVYHLKALVVLNVMPDSLLTLQKGL